MHDHQGGSPDGREGLNLLPLWLQVLWAVAMAAVVAHHVISSGSERGTTRTWAAANAVLATGMLYMFLPWPDPPLRADVLVTAYCGLLVVTLTIEAAGWIITGSTRLAGLLITIDCGAMAYMSRVTDSGLPAVTYLFVAYYCVSAAAWARHKTAHAAHVTMAVAMAYMFFTMGSASAPLVERVFTSNGLDYAVYGGLLTCGALALWIAPDVGSGQRFRSRRPIEGN